MARLGSGTGVTQFHCRPEKDNQLFLVRQAMGGHHVINEVTGQCLTVPDGSTKEDTRIVVAPCDGRPGQVWGFRTP